MAVGERGGLATVVLSGRVVVPVMEKIDRLRQEHRQTRSSWLRWYLETTVPALPEEQTGENDGSVPRPRRAVHHDSAGVQGEVHDAAQGSD
jgi:hypothetical protein